ncbi:hypothetical protein P5V15_005542 [Pogonomyrmex californicus]
MRQIQELVYIILYLQFFIHNVSTFNIDILSKKNISNTNNIMRISEWECRSNNDCTAKNSMCNNNNLCQCASGYIFNADMTACIKVATRLYDSCEETVQCSAYLLSGAKCVENVCVCGPGFYYLHGRCNRYVGKRLFSILFIMFFLYIVNDKRYVILLIYIGLFGKCEQNIDCYVNADFEASTCDAEEKICKCSLGFYLREYRTCRREGKDIRVGSNCMTDEDCRVVGNAICGPTGTCTCYRAHFESSTGIACIPELGEPCQNNDVSYIQKSICRGGRWSCTNGTVASKDNRQCLTATREYKGSCHQDEQCYIFGPDAVCSNNKCVCNENISHYVENELFCWGNTGVGKTCIRDQDCFVKDFKGNLICNGTCNCPHNTRLSKDNMACIGPTELGGFCEINEDCVIPYSVCNEKVCSCDENYYEANKLCLPGINSTCNNNEDCTPEHSICNSNNCSCEANYVAVAIDLCVPVSLYGEPCSIDVQCSAITPGAICAIKNESNVMESSKEEDKICTCNKEDYYTLGKCFKKKFLGEICRSIGECYGSSTWKEIVCRNEKCTCDWGYKISNNRTCIRHPQAAKFFLKGGASNMVSTELFLIISLYFLVNYFRFV